MIYLILDNDIWLNSINESGKEENFIDNLWYWIEYKHVQILLPEIILAEWNRNRDSKKQALVKEWETFIKRAKKIFGNKVVNEVITPEKLDELSEQQLRKIESIFKNHAIVIPITDEYRLKATKLAEEKKAPFRTKNSIGDAYIFLAMTDYISTHSLSNCVFVTKNHTDFSAGNDKSARHKIHPDLESEFTRLNIDYFTNLSKFIHKYKDHLPTTKAIEEYKKLEKLKREDEKLTESFTKPLLLENLTGLRDSYIDNISHLDLILKEKSLTGYQVISTFGLINSDEHCRQYFFKKVEYGIWLEIFKRKGIFTPKNNPSPLKVENGYQTPYWEPLFYLERLSNKIKDGEELEFIDSILSIIKEVSENPKDNYRTWYLFIKILSNLPNEKVSAEILNFIPVWLEGAFDTSLQSSELCENLLPKFLSENPTKEDIEKAEIILKHLFALKIRETNSEEQDKSYYSKVSMHFLKNSLIDKDLITRIASSCSNDIIDLLSENLKKLYFDFPEGLNVSLKDGNIEFGIKARMNGKNLVVSNNGESVLIKEFEQYNEEQTKLKVIEALKELKVVYPPTKENKSKIDVLVHYLFNGRGFMFSSTSISKLDDEYHHAETEIEVFSLLFRILLNKIIKSNADRGIKLLTHFTFKNTYRHPFYRRIALFVTGENWRTAKSLFWERINNDGEKGFFYNSDFYKELYELLNKNQSFLDVEDIKALDKIIENGHPESNKGKRADYWKLRWYSALKDTDPFKTKYEKLSQSLKVTSEDYEKSSNVTVRSGDISPLSIEDVLQKSNHEIAEYIHSFKPKYSWDGPTIGGLSRTIEGAVKNKSQKFSDEIELYKDIYYIYVYHILHGFKYAWKNGETFDWHKVLVFCKEYILSSKFVSGELRLENDNWGATKGWVIGAIAELLTEGLRSDAHAFDLEFLPLTKEIIKILVSYLEPVEKVIEADTDFPTYVLNSTTGKVLMALLDYSLRRARNLEKIKESQKWEKDVIEIFEQTFENGIIDGYILTGWHFEQFYFLNKKWVLNKVEKNYSLEDKKWRAFFGSFTFGNPPFNREVYQLFYPYYERAINNSIEFKGFYNNGMIRHLVSFYFWDFESLEKEGLLMKFINQSPPASILELVNFVWRQEKYQENLTLEEKEKFEKTILNLWELLCDKYKKSKDKEEQKILARLSSFLTYAPELNEVYTSLILKSNLVIGEHFYLSGLIENLIKLKTKGNPDKIAKYIGQILASISIGDYVSAREQEHILDLVTYIYENGHKQIADKICNEMAKKGYEFLIDLHNKYK